MTSSEGEQVFPAVLQELYTMLDFVKRAGTRCNCPKEKLAKLELACEELKVLVQEKMESAMLLSVPLVVNVLIGKNWAEC